MARGKHTREYPTLNHYGLNAHRLLSPHFGKLFYESIKDQAITDPRYLEIGKYGIDPFTDEPSRPPRINLVRAESIRRLRWPISTPLGPIVRDINEDSALQRSVMINFSQIKSDQNRHGERSLRLLPDTAGEELLYQESVRVNETIKRTAKGNVPNWSIPDFEMLVAFGYPEVPQNEWDNLAKYIAGILPLELEFEPIATTPNLEDLGKYIS
jgi:hypothetical protein